MNDIAANIKRLRKEKGVSQEQFAQALHVTRQTVSAWERGMSRPGLETLVEIARVLEVEPEQLLYGEARGKKHLEYRSVSFWPVLGILPLFFFVVLIVLPLIMSSFFNAGTDAGILLCGQMFLAVVVVFCYCALKDEIRNRDYYEKTEREEQEEQD